MHTNGELKDMLSKSDLDAHMAKIELIYREVKENNSYLRVLENQCEHLEQLPVIAGQLSFLSKVILVTLVGVMVTLVLREVRDGKRVAVSPRGVEISSGGN